ncbi:MAG TPA: hypothetical protein V6D08_01650 [Candidatus Obscuribacterales bacterium]
MAAVTLGQLQGVSSAARSKMNFNSACNERLLLLARCMRFETVAWLLSFTSTSGIWHRSSVIEYQTMAIVRAAGSRAVTMESCAHLSVHYVFSSLKTKIFFLIIAT